MAAFNIAQMRKDGYTDDQIAGALAKQQSVDLARLRKDGYSTDQILTALNKPQAAPSTVRPRATGAPKATAAPTPPPKKLRWQDVPGEALQNLPESAKQVVKDMAQAVQHPVQTAYAVNDVLAGAGRNIGAAVGVRPFGDLAQDLLLPKAMRDKLQVERDRQTAAANAAGEFYKSRYGSVDGLKRTIAKDPAGFMGDASTVLSGGGSLAARAPGMAGRVGRVVAATGRAVDPVNAAIKTAQLGGKTAGKVGAFALGRTTSTSTQTIEEAARSGMQGGKKGRAFREQLRDEAPVEGMVTEAKRADVAMRKERNDAYNRDIAPTLADKGVLKFKPIDDAIKAVSDRGFYKGKVIDPEASEAWSKMDKILEDWRRDNPADFHTPEGMDALKKAIGSIRDGQAYGSPGRNAANQVYGAILDGIETQVPSYAEAMRGYQKSSGAIEDVEKTLSLGGKNSVDTSLRKILSMLKDNASTNYGRRADIGEVLEKYGADTLMPSVAGRSLSSWTPRGLTGTLSGAGAAAAGLFSHLGPGAFAGLAAASPRIVGEVVHGAGRVFGKPIQLMDGAANLYDKASSLAMAGLQAGRVGQGPEGLSAMVERYSKPPEAPPAAEPAPEAPPAAEPAPEAPQAEEAQTETSGEELTYDELRDRVEMAESRGDPYAVSPKGARGPMQTMPSTLRDPGFGVAAATSNTPEEQERLGNDYLDAMLDRYDRKSVPALAAYNWGPGKTDKWLEEGADFSKLPAETQKYIKKILGDDLGM